MVKPVWGNTETRAYDDSTYIKTPLVVAALLDRIVGAFYNFV